VAEKSSQDAEVLPVYQTVAVTAWPGLRHGFAARYGEIVTASGLMEFAMPNRLVCIGLVAAACVACSSEKSTPGTPTPGPNPTLSVTGVTVTIERSTNGFTYRVVTQLRESGGAAAPVEAIELTFTTGSTSLVTSRQEQVLPTSGNACPANATASSREMVVSDTVAGHPPASAVAVRVLYGASAVATASANVPPLPDPPPPQTFSIAGTITDQATGQPLANARVEGINGANLGRSATTDPSGNYTLTGLVPETFRLRASANNFDPGEQNVTIPNNPRADFGLKRSASATCAYSMLPNGTLDVPRVGGSFSIALSRTSGTCGWTASTDANWITLVSLSGSDSATLSYTVNPNAAFVPRGGVITVRWSGGESSLTVRQPADSPPTCGLIVTANNPDPVPNTGGSYTAQIQLAPGVPAAACGAWTASSANNPALTFPNGNTGPQLPATLNFNVPAQPAGGTLRSFTLTISVFGGSQSFGLTFNQSP